MNPLNDQEDQRTSPLSQKGVQPGHSYEKESDLFTLLGIASAVLAHRTSHGAAIVGTHILRLGKHIDKENTSALAIIADVKKTADNLSDLSRAVEALKTSTAVPLDVNSLLYDVWEAMVLTSYTSKTVNEDFELPENVPLVYAHNPLLAEVFRTMFENSLKAIDRTDREVGQVNIRSRHMRESDTVEIEIEDNGIGIPPEIVSKLFERPVPSPKLSTGIGLWLAGLMIARIGGKIWVQDTKVGQGTTMKVTLPATQAADTLTDKDHD